MQYSVAVTQYSVRVTCGPVQVEPLSVQNESVAGASRVLVPARRAIDTCTSDHAAFQSPVAECGSRCRSGHVIARTRRAKSASGRVDSTSGHGRLDVLHGRGAYSDACSLQRRESVVLRVGQSRQNVRSIHRRVWQVRDDASKVFVANRVVSRERTAEMSTQ
jgi:hypothetical protein